MLHCAVASSLWVRNRQDGLETSLDTPKSSVV
jgi:hypothetical protein